jgi:drug/metabolite transporter (DMT)-like permease
VIKRFVFIADSQRPGWWTTLGIALMVVGIAVIALLADTVPLVALLAALPACCTGAYTLGRGSRAEEKRAERAARAALIERELEVG